MFAETVTRLLRMVPVGLTSDQILWRLRRAGLRIGSDEILQALTALTQTGQVRVAPGGIWQLSLTGPGQAGPQLRGGHTLPAILGRFLPAPAETAVSVEDDVTDGAAADADWRKLLSYYASTQRLDPRGAVEERIDRHGEAWQLVAVDGAWWEAGAVRFDASVLPPTLRQALSRRTGQVCAVGYPVSVFEIETVAELIPALLLPAQFRLEEHHLILEIQPGQPVINPRWIQRANQHVAGLARTSLEEVLFPEGEDNSFPEIASRLGHAAATLLREPPRPGQPARVLELSRNGIHNAVGLFLPGETSFTKGVERDLMALTSWSDEQLSGTALEALLRGESGPRPAAPAFSGPRVLTHHQQVAADIALDGPITVIQGPPGTGKSEVILGLLSSIILNRRTALVVSRNHRALDEIERRLEELAGQSALLTRARDSEGERDTDLFEQLCQLADGTPLTEREHPADRISAAAARALSARAERARAARVTEINLALSELAEGLTHRGLPVVRAPSRWEWLTGLFRSRKPGRGGGGEYVEIARLRGELARLEAAANNERYDALEAEAAASAAAALPETARHLAPSLATIGRLRDAQREMRFHERAKATNMSAVIARDVLACRPIWAVSSLSAPARIPLHPALFDYVIFDEASQCDIASALPLFARAGRAVVVGDPKQLGFVPQLSLRQERALMDAAGIGPRGRHALAQSTNSLFDFTAARPSAQSHFLADQFRSAAEIVDYLNAEFYDGRLVAAREEHSLRWPRGHKPGLAWHAVSGRPSREEGGNVNHAEADAVVTLVRDMLREAAFDGSIGILSPFNAQVALIQRRVAKALEPREMDRLRISTIDRFQGGEADVILFSLVIGPGGAASGLTFYRRERRRLNVAISRARALCLLVGDRDFALRCQVPTLAALARERRPRKREGFDSEWERRLFEGLRQRGIEPMSQHPVGCRSLDLAVIREDVKLDIEVDGRRWHTDPDGNRKIADRLRDRELIARGWKVRRFWVHELAADMEKCIDIVEHDLGRR